MINIKYGGNSIQMTKKTIGERIGKHRNTVYKWSKNQVFLDDFAEDYLGARDKLKKDALFLKIKSLPEEVRREIYWYLSDHDRTLRKDCEEIAEVLGVKRPSPPPFQIPSIFDISFLRESMRFDLLIERIASHSGRFFFGEAMAVQISRSEFSRMKFSGKLSVLVEAAIICERLLLGMPPSWEKDSLGELHVVRHRPAPSEEDLLRIEEAIKILGEDRFKDQFEDRRSSDAE